MQPRCGSRIRICNDCLNKVCIKYFTVKSKPSKTIYYIKDKIYAGKLYIKYSKLHIIFRFMCINILIS